MKIISKYVLKEHVGPLLFAFTALTSLLLLNYIARQLGQLVGKGLGWQVIGEFLLLSIPFTFAMTVPMSILVSVLYAFSRLAAENEVTAFKASGISMWRLLAPVLAMGFLFMVGMIYFNDQILPRANHRLAQLQYDIMRTKPTFALKEQVINELQRERLYLRASRVVEGTSRLVDVTVYDLTNPTRRRTIYADSGTIAFAPNQRDLHMTLYDGVMQEVPTDTPEELTRLFFASDRISVPDVGDQFTQTGGAQSKSDREMSVCEMNAIATVSERRARQAYNMYRRADARIQGQEEPADVSLDPGPTLGSVYCAVTDRLFSGPEELHAAQPSQLPGGRPVPPTPQSQGDAPAVVPGGLPVPQPVDQPIPGVTAQPIPGVPGQPDGMTAGPGPTLPTADETERDDALRLAQSHRNEANKYLVEIHKKFALAFACFVFVLVGAPIALRFPRGGVGLTLGVSFAIFGLYYVGLISGESLANRDIVSPGVSMWTTNAIMFAVGLVLATRMGRETGSGRGGGALTDFITRVQYAATGQRRRR